LEGKDTLPSGGVFSNMTFAYKALTPYPDDMISKKLVESRLVFVDTPEL